LSASRIECHCERSEAIDSVILSEVEV
jgi:hypothetical protein